MIRVVIDTNIVVSALLQPLGPPAQVFSLVYGVSIQFCVSGEVKCMPSTRKSSAALGVIRERGFWVKPTEAVRECADPDAYWRARSRPSDR